MWILRNSKKKYLKPFVIIKAKFEEITFRHKLTSVKLWRQKLLFKSNQLIKKKVLKGNQFKKPGVKYKSNRYNLKKNISKTRKTTRKVHEVDFKTFSLECLMILFFNVFTTLKLAVTLKGLDRLFCCVLRWIPSLTFYWRNPILHFYYFSVWWTDDAP